MTVSLNSTAQRRGLSSRDVHVALYVSVWIWLRGLCASMGWQIRTRMAAAAWTATATPRRTATAATTSELSLPPPPPPTPSSLLDPLQLAILLILHSSWRLAPSCLRAPSTTSAPPPPRVPNPEPRPTGDSSWWCPA
jgi:hypothetical protein